MQQILISPRLRLRPLSADDLDAFHDCLTQPEVRRYMLDDRIIGREQAAEIIHESEASFTTGGFGFYGLLPRGELRASHDDGLPAIGSDPTHDSIVSTGLIGFCGHRTADFSEGLELQFGLFPSFWGKGLGSEAARAVLDRVFRAGQIERVLAATDTPNQRSVRVLQRLGMTFECRREVKGLDTVIYSLCREDYFASCTSAS